MKLFLRLLQYVKPYSAYLVGALACIIVLAAITGLIAFLVKPVIDDIFVKNTSTISLSDVRDPFGFAELPAHLTVPTTVSKVLGLRLWGM